MRLVRRVESEPGDGAIGPGTLPEPMHTRVARSELQHYKRAGKGFAEKENAACHRHQDARAFPGQNLEPRIETLLRSVPGGKPALVADDLAASTEDSFANPLSFSILENDVDPKRNHRRQNDGKDE